MKRQSRNITKSKKEIKKSKRKNQKKKSRRNNKKRTRKHMKGGTTNKCPMQKTDYETEDSMIQKFGPSYLDNKSRGAILNLKFKPSTQELDDFSMGCIVKMVEMYKDYDPNDSQLLDKKCNWNIKSPYEDDTPKIRTDCELFMLMKTLIGRHDEVVSSFESIGFKIDNKKLADAIITITNHIKPKIESNPIFRSQLFKKHISQYLEQKQLQTGGGSIWKYFKEKGTNFAIGFGQMAFFFGRCITVVILWIIQKILKLYCSFIVPIIMVIPSILLSMLTIGYLDYYDCATFMYMLLSGWLIPLDIATAELLKAVVVHEYNEPIWKTGYEDTGDHQITDYACTHLYSAHSTPILHHGGGTPKKEPTEIQKAIRDLIRSKLNREQLEVKINQILNLIRQQANKPETSQQFVTFTISTKKTETKIIKKIKKMIMILTVIKHNTEKTAKHNNKTTDQKKPVLTITQRYLTQIIDQVLSDDPQPIILNINDDFMDDKTYSIDTSELKGLDKFNELLAN